MIWLYVSWLILLLGAQVAYYHQHPTLLNSRRGEWRLGNEARERTAILATLLIGYNYYHRQEWWSLETLAQRMNMPSLSLQPILAILEKSGIISESGEGSPGYFPARDLGTITVASVIEAVRRADAPPMGANEQNPEWQQVGEIMRLVDGAISSALAQQTIKDLVLAQAAPETEQV